ncbi:MAG TPA: response regulator [Skermanella sp.]|nr:response regulator [Skermanella sp.]
MIQRRALVAEDSLLVLIALEMVLIQHGIDIVGPASTVDEAMELAQTGRPEVAILDVNLHGEMIFPVADFLVGRGVPVILTTGYSARDILPLRLLDLPSIRKPYEPTELMELVERAFACVGDELADCP